MTADGHRELTDALHLSDAHRLTQITRESPTEAADAVPLTGLIMGVLMLVPPTVGEIGVWISMVSLVPTLIWMILMSRWLFRTARTLTQ
jgi:hypothetical protein